MSNVGLIAMFYYGSDVFALTDQHVTPLYKIRLNMKDMLFASKESSSYQYASIDTRSSIFRQKEMSHFPTLYPQQPF